MHQTAACVWLLHLPPSAIMPADMTNSPTLAAKPTDGLMTGNQQYSP